jgi:hypothetical protein
VAVAYVLGEDIKGVNLGKDLGYYSSGRNILLNFNVKKPHDVIFALAGNCTIPMYVY